MMKKMPYLSVTLRIDRLSSKGFGAAVAKKTVASQPSKMMVPCAIPGDTIVAEIGPKRKRSYIGKLLEIVTASKDRREAICKHAPVCGGCSLHYMNYEKQLEYKTSIIKDLFQPIFTGAISPIVPSTLQWRYRNKMEYTFSQNKEGKRFLGLMRAGTKGRVENLEECHLAPEWFTLVLKATKQWWDQSDILAFLGMKDVGSLRNLTVREGKRTGQKMVILTVSGNPEYALNKEQLKSFVFHIQTVLPSQETLSIFLRVQQAIRGQPTQFYEMNLTGPDHIEEELRIECLDFKKRYLFKVSPTAFFQPNTDQAEKLYSKVLEIAGLKKRNLVLDLYAGTATLGMIFSSFAEKVVAIELNPYAVFDAEVNRELNNVDNLQVFKGDVPEVLKDLRKKDSSFKQVDLIVLDPPRTGLLFDAVEVVLSLKPLEILYISCAPKQQVRDCLVFQEAGYEVVCVQPVDQFPHTIHIENIALLRRAK